MDFISFYWFLEHVDKNRSRKTKQYVKYNGLYRSLIDLDKQPDKCHRRKNNKKHKSANKNYEIRNRLDILNPVL